MELYLQIKTEYLLTVSEFAGKKIVWPIFRRISVDDEDICHVFIYFEYINKNKKYDDFSIIEKVECSDNKIKSFVIDDMHFTRLYTNLIEDAVVFIYNKNGKDVLQEYPELKTVLEEFRYYFAIIFRKNKLNLKK